jgi:hypothetical protein
MPIVALVLAGCGPSETSKPPVPPAATPTAAAPPAPPVASEKTASERASAFVALLHEGKYPDAYRELDAAMVAAVPNEDALRAMWTGVLAKVGAFKRAIATTEIPRGEHRIVLVTCEFDSGPMDVKVVYDKASKVAGFFIAPTQHPAAYGPRPQTPQPPYPYGSREVSYESPKENATIAGTLTLPAGTGPFPAVLLITGSGAQDRDETLFGHRPFLVIADHLTRRGIAVLRVDDRGVGKSSAENPNATVETHAVDVEAGIAFLKSQKEIDPRRIGLIGHSEGGIIAPIVASRSSDVAFIVALAGTGLPGSEINPMQVEAILRAKAGMSDEGIKAIVQAQRKLMALIAKDADESALRAALDEAIAVAKKHAPASEKEAIDKSTEGSLAALKSAWFRSFVKLDPRAYWSKLSVPALVLIGEKDTQVPADANLAAIKGALARAKAKDVTLEKLPGLNHLFQPATSGLVEEYAKIEQTFDTRALERIAEWLAKRAAVK